MSKESEEAIEEIERNAGTGAEESEPVPEEPAREGSAYAEAHVRIEDKNAASLDDTLERIEKNVSELVVLSKDAILNSDDRKVMPFEVPEWGGTIYLRQMKGKERDGFDASLMKDGKPRNFVNLRARFAVLVMSDSSGKRLFDDGAAGSLGEKNAGILDRIYDAGRKFNGYDLEEDDDGVDELEGN